MEISKSLEGALAWRCGYATGLRVALRMMRDCNDPPGRIKRELHSAMVEAQQAHRDAGGVDGVRRRLD